MVRLILTCETKSESSRKIWASPLRRISKKNKFWTHPLPLTHNSTQHPLCEISSFKEDQIKDCRYYRSSNKLNQKQLILLLVSVTTHHYSVTHLGFTIQSSHTISTTFLPPQRRIHSHACPHRHQNEPQRQLCR